MMVAMSRFGNIDLEKTKSRLPLSESEACWSPELTAIKTESIEKEIGAGEENIFGHSVGPWYATVSQLLHCELFRTRRSASSSMGAASG